MSIYDQSDALWKGEKFILGPMVRANSAALRWCALHFGADVVYSEEIIAQRAINCRRFENPVLNTVDFIRQNPNGGTETTAADVVISTH
jgi:tRNA-dihydrouridine synthase 2